MVLLTTRCWCVHNLCNFIQARIVALNSQFFLKNGGHFVISIKANCIDSTAEPEAVFAGEVKKMQAEKMKPQEQVALNLSKQQLFIVKVVMVCNTFVSR